MLQNRPVPNQLLLSSFVFVENIIQFPYITFEYYYLLETGYSGDLVCPIIKQQTNSPFELINPLRDVKSLAMPVGEGECLQNTILLDKFMFLTFGSLDPLSQLLSLIILSIKLLIIYFKFLILTLNFLYQILKLT